MLHVVEVVNFVLSDEREKGCAQYIWRESVATVRLQ